MIKIKRNCKEIEGSLSERNRSENRAKTGEKQGSARFRSLCEIGTLLQNQFATSGPSLQNQFWHTSATSQHRSPHFAVAKRLRSIKNSQFRSQSPISQGVLQLRNHPLAHECHFEAPYTHFIAVNGCETLTP